MLHSVIRKHGCIKQQHQGATGENSYQIYERCEGRQHRAGCAAAPYSLCLLQKVYIDVHHISDTIIRETIRSVIQSEYLNIKSASVKDIREAAGLVLKAESYRFIYNTVIESSPLLLAIKQGSVDEVRSLLQQLPREEAVRLIINGPDVQSAVLSIVNDAEYEEKLTDKIRRNYTLTDEQVTVITSTGLSKIIKHVISWITKYRVLFSCLLLAAARGSTELITLLLEYTTNSNIREFFTRRYIMDLIGYIIASHSSDQAAVTKTQILLERISEDRTQEVCIDWLIKCVFGGMCGVEVISPILKFIEWDNKVKNVIIGLLINTWDLGIKKVILVALLGKVPDIDLSTFLTTNFDYQNFPNPTEWLFNTSNRSLLSAARSSGAEKYIELSFQHTAVRYCTVCQIITQHCNK